MFTRTDIATVSRLASRAVGGSGSGHTVYAPNVVRRRYVVGGYVPTLLYPIGTAPAHMRVRIWDAVHADAAQGATTLGYWEDNGTVYVDLGDMYYSLDIALEVARERGELAIYDRETGGCIPVNPA